MLSTVYRNDWLKLFFDKTKELNLYEIKPPRLSSQNVVIGIDIDDIENLEDLLKKWFIDKNCGTFQAVVDGAELFRNIKEKHSYRQGHFSNSESVNQLGKHDFSCD